MNKVIISPSILSADFSNLERDIQKVKDAGVQWIHIDVMDGHFVPNITIGVPVVQSIRKITDLKLDVHLMIENPQKYIEPFTKAGADILTFHYEAVKETEILNTINKIKQFGVRAGISIKPKTDPEKLIPYLKYLDMVLIMTVEPGFGGQEFMANCAEKIKIIKKYAPQNLIIQVDGGINEQTGMICKEYGANSLVAGSYIYKSSDIKKAVLSLM
ncbi:ribulose-phosphate 3-epimerase [bacterium]|nr:ribulose-phosphate 3-epimerase [bacterium]